MQSLNKRVVLASEYPDKRSLISQIVEQERDVEIVGEAQDAVGTLTLARNLRPDVVILDCYLPHSTGLETIPLSRMSGLDVAQAISEEIPKTKVMLLNNMDKLTFSGGSLTPGSGSGYCMATGGTCISIAQWPQAREGTEASDPVFATIAARDGAAFEQKTTNIFDMIIFFGALGFAAGWLLAITIVLAPVGAGLAALGAFTAIVGLTGKLIASSWRKMRSKQKGA